LSIAGHISAQENYSDVDRYIDSLLDVGGEHELTAILENFDVRFQSEKDKIRAVYSWIVKTTEYDNNFYESESPIENRLDRITRTIEEKKGTCLDYSFLFDFMCSYLSINSGVVDGIVRQKKYESEDEIMANRHVWNYIAIEGEEYFIDVTFGELFYLVHPAKFIYTHFPDEQDWQLIPTPIDIDEYFNLPSVNSKIFLKEKGILNIYPKSNIKVKKDSKIRFEVIVHPKNDKKYKIGIRESDKFWIKQKTTSISENGHLVIDYLIPDDETMELQLMIKIGLGGYRELASYQIN
jgi:hypothetical protein